MEMRSGLKSNGDWVDFMGMWRHGVERRATMTQSYLRKLLSPSC